MLPQIQYFLEYFLPLAGKNGLTLDDEKEISYGVQLKFRSGSETIPLNVYYSAKKKGISTVIGGSPKNRLRPLLTRLLNKPAEPPVFKHEWNTWIGSDESGKGDFFGPLIVAAFYGERKIIPYLQQIGVKDSKLLNETAIEEVGKKLYGAYFDNIKTVTLLPQTYNRQYEALKNKGKNLNHMLAWMHARAITDLYEKYQPDGVMIDKFTTDANIRNALAGMKDIPFKSQIKGEEDLFVAAASIIARFHVNRWFRKVSEELGDKIPKGGNSKVDEAAQKLREKLGRDILPQYVKVHFNNYNKIL